MFPRLSYLYRLLAVIVFAGLILILLNNTSDLAREPYKQFSRAVYLQNIGKTSAEPVVTEKITNGTMKITTSISQNHINPHTFSYIINPSDLCNSNDSIKYLIYIHSAPKNVKKRQVIRQTWGAKPLMLKYNCRAVFILGVIEDAVTMQRIRLESSRYGDIMMENFKDTYRNLTYKAIAGLKWVSRYCSNVTYVIKSDDDILIDINSLMKLMSSQTINNYGNKKLILCHQWLRMKVIRDKKNKWYISAEEFPEDYFPPYCSGSVFIMSSDVVRAMYEASLDTKFFWVDDFYVTGLLVKKIGIEHKSLNEHYMLHAKAAMQKFTEDKEHVLQFFHVNKLTDIHKMWTLLGKWRNVTCDNCFTWTPVLNRSDVT